MMFNEISDAAAVGIGLVTVYVAKLAIDGWRKTTKDLVDASRKKDAEARRNRFSGIMADRPAQYSPTAAGPEVVGLSRMHRRPLLSHVAEFPSMQLIQ